jgi:hypothetical protein
LKELRWQKKKVYSYSHVATDYLDRNVLLQHLLANGSKCEFCFKNRACDNTVYYIDDILLNEKWHRNCFKIVLVVFLSLHAIT